MPLPNTLKSGFIYLSCPRCACANRFSVDQVAGPLGIFCRDCGSPFERSLLARIRDALRHEPSHHKRLIPGIIPGAPGGVPSGHRSL